jgi:thiosulfate/3-mercaptopyruvate sulfurtransferase
MHEKHGGNLSCQVCHSISYTSCDGCHVALSDATGNPFFSTEGSYLGFYIGRNVYKSYDRPYEYVTVRHVPVDANSFQFYGDNLLPGFNNRPTWAYTTPHNIQRNTPQTESCDACHGNAEIFLTVDKVYPEELDANLDVVVTKIPPSIFELLNKPTDVITATQVTTP